LKTHLHRAWSTQALDLRNRRALARLISSARKTPDAFCRDVLRVPTAMSYVGTPERKQKRANAIRHALAAQTQQERDYVAKNRVSRQNPSATKLWAQLLLR
jgi:hypothetical protein